MRLRKVLPWLVTVVVAVAALYGYRRLAARPPLIEVTVTAQEDVVRLLAVTGRVRARLANTVQPLVAGTLLRLHKEEGDRVRKGDVIATLDAQTTLAARAQANAQLAARRIDVEQQRREYDRIQRLVSAGGLPERDREQALFALNAGEESVRQLQSLVREVESRLRDYTLHSPIDGYVLSRPLDPGQNVTPQTVLYELATSTDAEVEVEIDEQYLGELREGLRARVSPLTGDRQVYAAMVTYIGKQVNETSGAVPVRLQFTDSGPQLPVGSSLDVNLEVATHPGAVTVDRAAVAGLGSAPYIMLVRSDTVWRTDVQVIDWPSQRIVILRGAAVGDTIAATPRLLRNGAPVRTRTGTDAL